MLEEQVRIFVYGTLMENFGNYNKFLSDYVVNIQRAYTKGILYHLKNKECPALIEGDETIFGEVITFVDNEKHSVLKSIDNLEEYFEGNPEVMYERRHIKVYYENESSEQIYAYIFINPKALTSENCEKVYSGDWRAYVEMMKIE